MGQRVDQVRPRKSTEERKIRENIMFDVDASIASVRAHQTQSDEWEEGGLGTQIEMRGCRTWPLPWRCSPSATKFLNDVIAHRQPRSASHW